MKILFFSDIHGIKQNLHIIKEVIEENDFDKIVVLGDLYYAGPNYEGLFDINSKDVKDFLMNYKDKIIAVRGNCDSDVDIKSSDFIINDGIAMINTDGIDIYCTHGDRYSYNKQGQIDLKGVLVYGHEHIPYIKKENELIYICVGSISLPRNNSMPSYMIYENQLFTIYDIKGNEIEKIKAGK